MSKRTAIQADCAVPVRGARLSLWPELLWAVEWAELKASPVYRGAGVARGREEPVVVVPGFLGSDLHTGEIRRWLGRIGYSPHASGIGRNADCPDVGLAKLEERLEEVASTSRQRVAIVGHSLGGTLGRAAAVRRPDLVSRVITLGSPLRSVRAHPLVLWIARLLGDVTPMPSASPRRHGDHVHDGSCACDLVEALALPFPEEVNGTSIYSRRDGIVDWRSCIDASPGQNVAVSASHLGMLVNRHAYAAIATALAGTPASQRLIETEVRAA